MRRFLPITVTLAACAAPMDMPFDVDEDGLLDNQEEVVGTDPSVADSDGDGHLDGSEVEQGTDPLDADDYPYHGGWTIDGACRDAVTGNIGSAVGDTAANFALVDQHGDRVRLHDFCAQVVVLKRSAGWCGACRGSESAFADLYKQFAGEGYMAITLLSETDSRGEAPDDAFLTGWAEQYGVEHAVVTDDEGVGQVYEKDGGIPSYVIIEPGMVLHAVDAVDAGAPDASMIEDLLP